MKKETLETLEEYVEQKRKLAANVQYGDGQKTGNAHAEYMEALQTLNEIEKDHNEFYDKQERREIEKQKNDDATAVEMAKQNVSGKRFVLEMAKIVVPIVTGVVSAVTVLTMQNKAGKFEESGSWPSKASQMTYNQAPRIWK